MILCLPFYAQKGGGKKKSEEKSPLEKVNINGLNFRSIGPALTAGRIADIAVNENNPKEYYVAVASGENFKCWKYLPTNL